MEAILEPLFAALFEFLIGPLLALLGYALLAVVFYAVGMPILCLVCTPFVLICACFGPGIYAEKVIGGYKGVVASANLGSIITPL